MIQTWVALGWRGGTSSLRRWVVGVIELLTFTDSLSLSLCLQGWGGSSSGSYSSCLRLHATSRCTTSGGRIEIGFIFVQEVGFTTQRVGAGKLPIRVRNMLLTCCCFVQKLLELQTVVGLLLGGGWGVAGVMVPVGVRGWWPTGPHSPPKSCEQKNARAHPPCRKGRGGSLALLPLGQKRACDCLGRSFGIQRGTRWAVSGQRGEQRGQQNDESKASC